MIALLNLVPLFIGAVAIVIAHYMKTLKSKVIVIAVGIVVVMLYGQVQPSYLPKGVAAQSKAPAAFVVPEGEIVDRVKKPVSSEERDKALSEKYKEAEIFRERLINDVKSEKEK